MDAPRKKTQTTVRTTSTVMLITKSAWVISFFVARHLFRMTQTQADTSIITRSRGRMPSRIKGEIPADQEAVLMMRESIMIRLEETVIAAMVLVAD